MLHFQSLDGVNLHNTWLTIGTFDGIHLGHQAIIHQMVSAAHDQGHQAVVLTFHPHPKVVLRSIEGPFYLTSPDERAEFLGMLDVDVVVTYPFNLQVAGRSAYDFVSELQRRLDMKMLWVGPDFALGRGREGDTTTLRRIGLELGYEVHVIQPVQFGGEVVSSSRIRSALLGGDLVTANRLLGRPYRVTGDVVPGDGRGRRIGIPTANLHIAADRVVPAPGVYACHVQVDGILHPAVTNIGYRPTFETQPVAARVETHLLDYNLDLYDQNVEMSFVARLRDEQRFASVEALITQIHADIENARAVL